MEFWQNNVDKILEFQDKKVLQNAGSNSKAEMEKQVRRVYGLFDQRRIIEGAKEADAEDLESLKKLADRINKEK